MGRFEERMSMSYSDRAQLCENSCGKRLLELMDEKKTNLTLAADVSSPDRLLELAKKTGNELIIFKTHIDIVDGFQPSLTEQLQDLARDLNFLLFEDRKFIDIGKTVREQYSRGTFKIAYWAHIVNAFVVPGPGVIEGLYEVAKPLIEHGLDRGLILLPQMTSKGTLAKGAFTTDTIKIGKEHPEFVIGHIGAGSVPPLLKKELASIAELYQIIATPGVQIGAKYGILGQRYASPEETMAAGSDTIIVGSGICGAPNPLTASKKYRQIAWKAYQRRLKKS